MTHCTVRDLLRARAAEYPDRPFMLFENGTHWTFADALARARECAAGLTAIGVRAHDFVLSWQGNGPQAVATFLALNTLGAVYVPINTGYRGALLAHVIRNSGARLMIADGRLVHRLTDLDTAQLTQVAVLGNEALNVAGVERIPESALAGSHDALPEVPIAPDDTHMVIYTSGTTGPSKGVLSSSRHSFTAATGFRNIGPGDRNLMQLPMFHVGGPYAVLWALIHGGSSVVIEAFSVSRFWDTVRRYDITTVGLLGAMTQFLMKQPPAPNDTQHSLRSVIIAPFDESAIAFGQRFGVPVYTEFNMTELSVPLWAGPNPTVPGTVGRARDGFDLRLIDGSDQDVADGEPGELIVRPHVPRSMSHGYLNDEASTARAWRNGWFHTGDLLRRDTDGNYFFVDRIKDVIRRRGECISSFEVERALQEHPAIREAAVVPVPSEYSEDEVLAVIALQAGMALDPAALIDDLSHQLAYFMIPRYVRFIDQLPRTPTQKVEKHVLRAAGVTADTWDREAAGIRVGRDRLQDR